LQILGSTVKLRLEFRGKVDFHDLRVGKAETVVKCAR
jgi:hypothetical protein